MTEHYDQAAIRHFNDAQLLESKQRLANADQLYGLAAECALKWVWPATRRAIPKKHVNELWDQMHIASNRQNNPGLNQFRSLPNPFVNWSIDQRYGADSVVNPTSLATHRDIARRLLGAAQLLGSAP